MVVGFLSTPNSSLEVLNSLDLNIGEVMSDYHVPGVVTRTFFYPEVEEFVVMNNSEENRETNVYNANGKSDKLSLKPLEMKWFTLNELNEQFK